MPVDLSKKDYNKLMNLALKAHKLIGCRGLLAQILNSLKENFIF